MRHLGSLVLSLLLTPAIYLLLGYGVVKSDHSGWGNFALAAVAVVVAGVLYSLLILARLSPLGTALAGLALADVSVWSMLPKTTFADNMPGSLFGIKGVFVHGAGPITLALAVPLILTIFSGRRWQRSPGAASPGLMASSDPTSPTLSSTSPFGGSAFGSPISPAATFGDSTSPTSPAFGSAGYQSVLGSTYTPPSYPGTVSSSDDPGTTHRL